MLFRSSWCGFILLFSHQNEEKIKGPLAWKDFGVGAWAEVRTRQWSPGGRLTDDWSLRTTYKGIEGENADFEESIAVTLGAPHDSKPSLRKKPFAPEYVRDKEWALEKEETIRLAGRDILCKVFVRKPSTEEETRYWVAKDYSGIPAPVVKQESQGKSFKDGGEVGDWGTLLKLGSKEIKCIRYDFKMVHVNPVSSFTVKSFLSMEIPGYLVKSECDYGGGGRQLDELSDYQVKSKK